jgi:hypothetical protein
LIAAGAFSRAVEMVEALTVVLGVGVVRGWRSTLMAPTPPASCSCCSSLHSDRPSVDPDQHPRT